MKFSEQDSKIEWLHRWFQETPGPKVEYPPRWSKPLPRNSSVWPMEKQRRSSIDWYALVPDHVAYNQIRWERHQTVLAMRDAGMTLKEIGLRFDMTRTTISLYARLADRWRRKPLSLRLSPVEEYFAKPLFKPSRLGPDLAED